MDITRTALLILLVVNQEAISDTRVCGEFTVEAQPVEVYGGIPKGNHKLVVSKESKTSIYEFSGQNDYINIKCIKTGKGVFLVVNNNCGGSGCADYNVSIINLDENKLILEPSGRYNSNLEEAEKYLGTIFAPFNCKEVDTACYSAIFK